MRRPPRLFDSTLGGFYEIARTVESVSHMADGDSGARRLISGKVQPLFFKG